MISDEILAGFADDLAPFADIGTDAPAWERVGGKGSLRLSRKGTQTELIFASTGHVEERYGDQSVSHSSFKALLASERFGDLRTWASRQSSLLQRDADEVELLNIRGELSGQSSLVEMTTVDKFLSEPAIGDTTKVLLIDGPAGIGKTYFISELARLRCVNYLSRRDALILHIQSRGRTLSYLLDLMAFSLQRLRLDVTYDQVPVLAKYGLITIAIDGFDELADPEGYEGAWQQVSDLVANVRGSGVVVLAGRETFIGRDRILRDVSSLRSSKDEISVLTLQAPSKSEATSWLSSRGWVNESLTAIGDLLEPRSLALRPFFLKTLSDSSIHERLQRTESTSVLSILIEAMIDREASKFGDEVERHLNLPKRRDYVRSLMSEVARDLAENNSVSVSEGTLSFLAEVAMPSDLPDTVRRILKQRAGVVAFLTNDERAGYRRFYHEKFFEYFLSRVIIAAVRDRQAIKPISRGLFAASFLDTFGEVVTGATSESDARSLLEGCEEMLQMPLSSDRTRRNIASFVIASLAVAELVSDLTISDVEVEEVRFSGVASKARIKNIVIGQFDIRGADLSDVLFENCQIINVISDSATLISEEFPSPVLVQNVENRRVIVSDPSEIENWRVSHLANNPIAESGLVPEELRDHDAIRILQKACRIRQYWLRRGDDVFAARILDNEYWPLLEGLLSKHELLTLENRQASGTNARFIHIRKSGEIMEENAENENVSAFYRDLPRELQLGKKYN